MRLLIVLNILLCPIAVSSQTVDFNIDTVHIESVILKENRDVIVYKPTDISKTDSVKFVYLLDGEFVGYRFQSIKERFKDSLSNLIAVGIINTDRKRDLLYVKGADKFLDFIVSELIPIVEKGYKTNNRTLYGHSFGGGFAIYTVVNRPGSFDYYIASSPTPIMDLVKEENFLRADSISNQHIKLYFTVGSDDLGQVVKWSEVLKANLMSLKLKNLDWHYEIFDGKNHNNSDIAALLYCLYQIYL